MSNKDKRRSSESRELLDKIILEAEKEGIDIGTEYIAHKLGSMPNITPELEEETNYLARALASTMEHSRDKEGLIKDMNNIFRPTSKTLKALIQKITPGTFRRLQEITGKGASATPWVDTEQLQGEDKKFLEQEKQRKKDYKRLLNKLKTK